MGLWRCKTSGDYARLVERNNKPIALYFILTPQKTSMISASFFHFDVVCASKVHFNWRDEEEVEEDSARRVLPKNRRSEDTGFIAQEVEAVAPELVSTNEDGDNAAPSFLCRQIPTFKLLFFIFSGAQASNLYHTPTLPPIWLLPHRS